MKVKFEKGCKSFLKNTPICKK
ncbi:Protein of unknown function [Lactobacillus helveticus CIRM-BIA 953]|uniref:Uncharacterized protein n=1 Tax=Lactobacillus helveticus CIRM-BIA 953 TaxID=1226335 RepID=U4QLC6_LACHE|nr:Protein of unknown function [Lactobacillus helveticus CIRM-BIA 953]